MSGSSSNGPGGWALVGMGTSIAAILLVPMALGWLLDRALGTLPIFVMVGLVLGLASAARYTYVEVRRIFGSGHD
jgi:F0F1-type ATP synthase assembly protein I